MDESLSDIYLFENDSSSTSDSESDDEPLASYRKKRKVADHGFTATHESDSDKENNLPSHLRKPQRLMDIIQIHNARQAFQSKSKSEQHQWILDYLSSHSRCDGGVYSFVFIIGTTTVCFTAWQIVLGIPRSTAFGLLKRFKDGNITLSPSNLHKIGFTSISVQNSISWFVDYTDKFADKVPNQVKLHLPSCLTKHDVYNSMALELGEQGIEVCSQSHFYRIWRKKFRHIVIPAMTRFAKCEKCTFIKMKLEETKDKVERSVLKSRREKHLQRQNTERRKYYKHTQKAKKHPDKYMSVIIDGMDQSKTYLPHFKEESKFISTMLKLKTHLTGVIVHGLGTYGYFDVCQWPHSSNLTLNILLSILLHYKDTLPPVLYLQMDNCSRENKNRFVFAFCCLLVELKIFTKIKVSFLMVGHTHEDIDQVFSRFSTWLNKHSAVTIPRLMSGFQKCYKPSPKSMNLHHLFNISEWLGPYIESMTQHSKPHLFKFTLNTSGKAVMHTKKWSTNYEWRKCESVSEDIVLLKQIPPLAPNTLSPQFNDIDVCLLEKDIETVGKYMGDCTDREWWTQWLNDIKQDNPPEHTKEVERWPLQDLVQAVTCKRMRQQHQSDPTPTISVEISDEDDPIPMVTLGKKKQVARPVLQPNRVIQVGDLALTDILKYAEFWPQLGEVVAIDGNQVKLHWYKGSLSGTWTPWMLTNKGRVGTKTPWVEDVNTSVIWLYGFLLTPKSNLPKALKDAIVDYYG